MGTSQSIHVDKAAGLDDTQHDNSQSAFQFVSDMEEAATTSEVLHGVESGEAGSGNTRTIVNEAPGCSRMVRGDSGHDMTLGAEGGSDGQVLTGHIVDSLREISRMRSNDPEYPRELMALGASMHSRFYQSGAIEHINNAIYIWGLAVSLTPGAHIARPSRLNNLGVAYQARFDCLGNLVDLNKSIECKLEAISLTPDGHTDKPSMFTNLGASYLAQFIHLGELLDLNKAIEYLIEAVTLTPDEHPIKPLMLSKLGNSYQERYVCLGELPDLSKSIEYGEGAAALTPDGHEDMPDILNSLGLSYRLQFERLGERVDLEKTMKYLVEAVTLTPNNNPRRPAMLSNLGNAYYTQFGCLGKLVDLNKAIDLGGEAVSLTPDSHPDKPSMLNSLGHSYRARFHRLGELSDLDTAIKCGADSVLFTPEGHAKKPSRLSDLGIAHRARFMRLGELLDLDKSIECGAEAVSLTPDVHVFKPNMLNDLGNSYASRFERLGELSDLSKSIQCKARAISLTPHGHPDKPSMLSNLGLSYRARFERLGEPLDINKAIEYLAEAVALAPGDHSSRPVMLNNLGNSYQARVELLGNLVDLKHAIEHLTEAVLLTPDGHANKPSMLSNLGNSYGAKFNCLGEPPDLSRAISHYTKAVSLTPDGHPGLPGYLAKLGQAYNTRFGCLQKQSDLQSAVSCFTRATQSPTGAPFVRFKACRAWAQLATVHQISSPYLAYQQAMKLLPQLVWVGTTLERRYTLMAEIGDLATEAALHAISINACDLALEWLEVGRSIVWGQIAQLRTPFEELSSRDPELASKLEEIGRKLEHAGSRSVLVSLLEIDGPDLDKEAKSHHQLADSWEKLLGETRSIPGFEDFLRAPRSSQLLRAAKSHPIAIINIHESRCDALIIQPHSDVISHVPLTDFSVITAAAARGHLDSLVNRRWVGKLNKCGSRERSLNDLWLAVVKPVLDFLEYTQKLAIDQLPRITWCTTGLLSFLPLHAAGGYDQSQLSAFDLVISSYTPTLSALLANQSTNPSAHSGILGVGQEHTPGLSSLPFTKDELMIVQKYAQKCCYLKLENNEATVDRVLDAMDKFSWVHMACHGTQDQTDPTQSAFHLYDGSLTLATLTKRVLHNKGLAFLSACQTAMGDEDIPDEAVHLAAGMLMAGYPSVIATMWSIADEDGPEVADQVYAELLKGGEMDCTKAAKALHQAVGRLRAKVGEKSLARWAPFIHIGT